MAGVKDWLAMSRHERRGALAMVLLAVAVVIAVRLVRSQNHQLTPAEQQQIRQFELLADSLQQQSDSAKHASMSKAKPKTKKREPRSKSTEKAKDKGRGRSRGAPQRMDPVPQF